MLRVTENGTNYGNHPFDGAKHRLSGWGRRRGSEPALSPARRGIEGVNLEHVLRFQDGRE